MNRRKSAIGILVVATIAATIGVGSAVTGGESQSEIALSTRSDALNRQYGLGKYAPTHTESADESTPAQLRALMIRSDALNRLYGLGKYAPRHTASATEPTSAQLRALMIRSDALNRLYGLGKYAPKSP